MVMLTINQNVAAGVLYYCNTDRKIKMNDSFFLMFYLILGMQSV